MINFNLQMIGAIQEDEKTGKKMATVVVIKMPGHDNLQVGKIRGELLVSNETELGANIIESLENMTDFAMSIAESESRFEDHMADTPEEKDDVQ